MKHELVRYIHDAREVGMSHEDIRQSLEETGWDRASVDDAFQEFLQQTLPPDTHTPSSVGISDESTLRLVPHFFYTKIGKAIGTCAVFLLALGMLVGGWVGYEKWQGELFVSLDALDSDLEGVAVSSHFVLRSSRHLSEKEIRNHLSFQPHFEYAVRNVSLPSLFDVVSAQDSHVETQDFEPRALYEIDPVEDLKIDTIYRARYEKEEFSDGWAFQIKAPFQVIETHPRNQAVDVPTNTAIELMFNRDALGDPNQLFTISPSTKGRFEYQEGKIVFLPDAPFSERTVYTVTLKKEFQASINMETLENDYTFSFETGDTEYMRGREPYVSFSRDLLDVLPNRPPTLEMYDNLEKKEEKNLTLTVYAFNGFDAFVASYRKWMRDEKEGYAWSNFQREKKDYASYHAGALKAFSFPVTITRSGWQGFIQLPDSLNAGYYLFDLKYGKNHEVAWAQSSPLAHYSAISATKSFLWLTDFPARAPAANRSISLLTRSGKELGLGSTGSDGILEFVTPRELQTTVEETDDAAEFFKVNDRSLPLLINAFLASEGSDAYWDYLFTDRYAYQPRDTIHYWGIIKGRTQDLKQKKVRARLVSGMGEEVLSHEVMVSPFDSITGELKLAGVEPGYYYLEVRFGEETVATRDIEIATYTKPAYQITMTPSREQVFAGEKVDVQVKASFFDGTPVSGLKLRYSGYWSDALEGGLSLDKEGTGTISVTPDYREESGEYGTGYPQSLFLSVFPERAEEGEIGATASVQVFGPDLYLETYQKELSSNRFKIEAKLNAITLGQGAEYIGAPVVNHSITAKIIKRTYTKRQVGTFYDPIDRTTHKEYEYDFKDEEQKKIKGVSDARGLFSFEEVFREQDHVIYRVVISGKDSKGRKFESVEYPYTNTYNSWRRFSISLEQQDNKSGDYSFGDPISLDLLVTEGKKKVISPAVFFRYQNGISRIAVEKDFHFEEPFQKAFAPSVVYRAVVLSEYGFDESNDLTASFKEKDNELSIFLKSDKERYNPGDEVGLDVEIRDRKKSPTRAELVLSIIDQAVYHMFSFGMESDILSRLYTDITYPSPMTEGSQYASLAAEGGGRGGGGGGVMRARADFRDVAHFQTLHTNEEGKAHTSFKAPDSVTSWRVMAHAYEPTDMKAGSHHKLIEVSLPFFVEATTNTHYLVNDQPIIRVRAFGTDVVQGKETTFTISSPTLSLNQELKTKNSSVEFAIPALSKGEHELTIGAHQGELRDAIVKKIHVSTTYFKKTENVTYTLTEGLSGISGNEEGVTRVSIMDNGKGRYYSSLLDLACLCGLRVDQLAPSQSAGDLLHTYFDDSSFQSDPLDLAAYQREDGGISLFPYSASDLEISATIADFAPASIQKEGLRAYLYAALSDEKADVHRAVRALYGLASLNEPVLRELQKLSLTAHLEGDDQVYLGLALAKLGDVARARNIYTRSVRPLLHIQGEEAWLEGEPDISTRVKRTSRIGVLASYAQSPDARVLWNYMSTHVPQKDLDTLEKILFIRSELPRTKDHAKTTFSYTAGSRRETITLLPGEKKNLLFSTQELASLTFTRVRGELTLISWFEREEQPAEIASGSGLELTRRYYRAGKEGERELETQEFQDGDIIKISLQPRFGRETPDGTYQVVDFLPSGLKPSTQIYTLRVEALGEEDVCQPTWYPTLIRNNTVYFTVEKGFEYIHDACRGSRTMNYVARVVTKGSYQANPALLQSLRDVGSAAVSEAARVQIK